MKVIGIDPSISGTALVYINNGIPKADYLIETSKIKQKVETQQDIILLKLKKLKKIYSQVYSLLDSIKPDVIAIEGYSYLGVRSLTGQAEVTAMILFAIDKYLWRENSKTILLSIQPTQLKKFITDKGTAKKELMIKEIYKRFNFDTDNNNVADAFCLAKVAESYAMTDKERKQNKLTKYQLNVLKELNKLKKKDKKNAII